MLKLDSESCLRHVDEALRYDGFNELAHGYRGYCYEIVGKTQDAKKWFGVARAMDIRGADRYYAMPAGYGPFLTSNYHKHYINALVAAVAYTEFTQFGLGGRDRWVSHLFELQTEFKTITELAAAFREREYVILRGLLSAFEIYHVHNYYVSAMNLFPNKEPFVTSCTNDRIGYWYNQRFKTMVSSIAELPLLVTYSYFVNYYGKKDNPGLKAHTDAVDNEYTMSTHVTEYPYAPAWIWPLYFVTRPKQPVTEMGTWESQPAAHDAIVVPALLNPGDALLFRGRKHPHFREPLDSSLNQSYGNMLSHFVKSDYPVWLQRSKHNEIYARDALLPERGHLEFER